VPEHVDAQRAQGTRHGLIRGRHPNPPDNTGSSGVDERDVPAGPHDLRSVSLGAAVADGAPPRRARLVFEAHPTGHDAGWFAEEFHARALSTTAFQHGFDLHRFPSLRDGNSVARYLLSVDLEAGDARREVSRIGDLDVIRRAAVLARDLEA